MSEPVGDEDLADLYEHAPCGYLSLSPDGRIVKVNRTLTDWLGSTAEALVGQPIHSLLSFGGRIAYETHMAPMLRLQGEVNELALDLVQADQGRFPAIANAVEKRGPDGEHLFTRLTLFKAVDRRSYERGLLAARNEAEAAARTEHELSVLREQFIAVLGHDLKNPLAALAAGIHMIMSRERLSERGLRVGREMAASIARATEMVENVLDLARGRLGGGLTLARERGRHLGPVLDQVVGEIRITAPDRTIETSFSLDQPVDCDPGRIGQLASNLLANAVTHGVAYRPIKISARVANANLCLSVANGGPPIPEDARSQLFMPFFRGGVRPSRQGLGLGLFIVNEIAKAHGGTMEVASTDDETRFTFTMPIARVEA